MKAFDRIREGLEQAIAHAAGEPVAVLMHRPAVPDVKSIRQKTSLTQEHELGEDYSGTTQGSCVCLG